ncbi:ABC transporter permease [Halorientalis pallida]|uniref:ABC transporter permease n=1 Tax=Halorientalis pallida TaxID=2479928 RepID=A0A498L2H7_9EURY|nr:ABC transporter permease [Halorientalis pallida]RXK47971.1 ABC transporter permease [Halorientalis pallida]
MTVSVTVEHRESTPSWLRYTAPLLTGALALLVAAVPLLVLNVNPVEAYLVLFVGTLLSPSGIVNTLVTAVPLFLTGLAVYIPYRAGLWNLGAEGQLFFGAVAGTFVGVNADFSAPVLLGLMFVASGIVGGLYGAIPGYLRAKHDVNEIITSLMLSLAAVSLTHYLVRGPMQGSGGSAATESLPEAALVPTVFSPRLHVGVVLLVVVAACIAVLMNHTSLGFRISFVGANVGAARQSGISEYRTYLVVFVLGGVLAGVAGIVEVAGVYGRLFEGFSPGYGFTAVAVALLGRNGVTRVLAAALFFGLLQTGGSSLAILMDVPTALVDVIVALIILFILTAEFFKTHRIDLRTGRNTDREGVS